MNGIALIRIEKVIPDLTAIVVLIIAGSSFVLSFFNLQAAAVQAGINTWLSWLWPVSIDSLLIAGSLMILRSSLRHESSRVGWAVLLTFTGISVAFNVIHSPPGWINQAAHAIPPLSLCVSIELLMMCVRSDLMTRGDDTPCSPEPAMVQHECILNALQEQEVTIPDQDGQPPGQMSTRDLIMSHYSMNPGCSISEAARTLGVSRSTISRHMKVLSLTGLVQE